MKTEALWYLGERKIKIDTAQIPDPEADEVLVEMEVCGICGWDLLSYSGKFSKFHSYPFRAGHEGVGRILRAGSLVKGLAPGARVACHEIPIDARGGGLMARHAVRKQSQVTLLPETSFPVTEWIVEPVACVVNGIEYSGIRPGDSVALVGAGYMGLLMLQLLRRTLAGRVTVFEPDRRRLSLAASYVQGLSGWSFKTPGVDAPDGSDKAGYDVVIETAGSAPALKLAFELAKPFAIIENFAWHHHAAEFNLDDWHTRGWRILNIQPQMNPGFSSLFPASAALMAIGAVGNAGLVTHVSSFENAEEAYAAGLDRTGGYIKGVIDFRARKG